MSVSGRVGVRVAAVVDHVSCGGHAGERERDVVVLITMHIWIIVESL